MAQHFVPVLHRPQLEAKVVDVVGLYLDPAENAIVLSVDQKSQIQALDRTAPVLPMQPHLIERRSHDYVRHGTTAPFAALEIATGKPGSSTPTPSTATSPHGRRSAVMATPGRPRRQSQPCDRR